MTVHFGWRTNAGLVCVCVGRLSIHLAVQRSDWVWGYDGWVWDGAWMFGLGPLLLVAGL